MKPFTLKDGALLRGGAFRIIRFINAGGFGCTYEAVHTGLDRRVAIKEFFVSDFCNRDQNTSEVSVVVESKKKLSEKLKRKFLDEARAVANLDHPGIVRVTDVFEENGTAYFVMDFIDGRSLDQLIADKGYLPEDEALRYIRQVANALAYVHGTKRLHLDIKPGNIMIDRNGRAILIDFGVSKQYDEAAGENTSTLIGRSAGYAPIEQMSPKLRTFTPATDIYALGATLYKALTGVTPPDATELHIGEELLFPPSLSTPVVNAIEAATRMRAEDRPQSVAAFLSILDAPAAPASTPTQPLSTPTQPLSTPTQPLPTPTQPLSTPTQPLSTPTPFDDPRRSSPSRGSGGSHQKQKSNKKHLLIAAAVAAVAILAAVLFILPSKSTPSPSTSPALAKADTDTASTPALETPVEAPDAESAQIAQEEEPAQDDAENYTGLPVASIFTSGGIKYIVTANGKVGVTEKKYYSGSVNIPAKVTYDSYTYDVTSIGAGAFRDCSNLTSVTIPSGVTFIGGHAFNGCSSLTSLSIPSGVTYIGWSAFMDCSSLTSITIPYGVTKIEADTFEGCTSLTSITLPSSVTKIVGYAFRDCTSLTSVTIPSRLTAIGGGVFSGCINLSAFHGKCASADNRCLIVDGDLYFFAPKGLTSYSIPSGITSIGWEAFRNCSNLTSVTIPSSVTSIRGEAFWGCSSLSSVTIPSSVTSIGSNAFTNCHNLTSVKIENPNCEIDRNAFECTPFDGKTNPADFR